MFPVILYHANGNIMIQQSNFISNQISQWQYTSDLFTNGLQIAYGKFLTNIFLEGNNFQNNDHLNVHPGFALYSVVILWFGINQGPPHPSFTIHQDTVFSNNTRGLYLRVYSCSAVINMSELTVHDNIEEGMIVYLDGFHSNECPNSVHFLSVSFSKFENNANSLSIFKQQSQTKAIIELLNSTFVSNKVQ